MSGGTSLAWRGRASEVSPMASHDRIIRTALWASVALNLFGVVVFLPAALGRAAPMIPVEAPRYFAAQIGFTIALFGGVYAWLARQPVIPRSLVVTGGLGKLGFFTLNVVYWLIGDLPFSVAWQSTPDLAFAGIFLWWAATAPRDEPTAVPSSPTRGRRA